MLKEAKSGESHAWKGFAVDTTLSPLFSLASGVCVMLRVYTCMCVCVMFNYKPIEEIFRVQTNTDLSAPSKQAVALNRNPIFIIVHAKLPTVAHSIIFLDVCSTGKM